MNNNLIFRAVVLFAYLFIAHVVVAQTGEVRYAQKNKDKKTAVQVNSKAEENEKLPSKNEVIDLALKVNNYWISKNTNPGNNLWARSVYHAGNIDFCKVYPEKEYLEYTGKWAVQNNWKIDGGPYTSDADNHTCGQVYVDLFWRDEIKDTTKIEALKAAIDYRIANNPASDDWWWIDAMLMGMPAIARLGVVYDDEVYFDKMYALFANIRDKLVVTSRKNLWPDEYRTKYGEGPLIEGYEEVGGLYNTTDKLWWRDWGFQPNVPPKKDPNNSCKTDVPKQSPNGKNIYWSRGNGWVLAAMARVLQFLPQDDAHRQEYILILQEMASAVKACQRTDGFWNMNLADATHYPGRETSGTALFAYAIAWGINNGLLDKDTYLPVVAKAWNGLAQYAVQANGNMQYTQNVGEGAIDPSRLSSASVDFGVGVFLLAASEVVQLAKGKMPEPPFSVEKVVIKDRTHFEVTFSRSILKQTAWKPESFKISNGVSVKKFEPITEKKVSVTLAESLKYQRYTLKVDGLTDAEGVPVDYDVSTIFVYPVPLDTKDATIKVDAIGNQAGNGPENTLDSNYDTRWAMQGLKKWIKYDLGKEENVWAVDISFYNGNIRKNYFDIEYSLDNQLFKPLLSNWESSGLTTELERFSFDSTRARYIRIMCNGHSAGTDNWNSITEVRVRYGEELTNNNTLINNDQKPYLYPNPFYGNSLTIHNVETEDNVEISILDITGKYIYSGIKKKANNIVIDNLFLSSGIYFLTLNSYQKAYLLKFLVK